MIPSSDCPSRPSDQSGSPQEIAVVEAKELYHAKGHDPKARLSLQGCPDHQACQNQRSYALRCASRGSVQITRPLSSLFRTNGNGDFMNVHAPKMRAAIRLAPPSKEPPKARFNRLISACFQSCFFACSAPDYAPLNNSQAPSSCRVNLLIRPANTAGKRSGRQKANAICPVFVLLNGAERQRLVGGTCVPPPQSPRKRRFSQVLNSFCRHHDDRGLQTAPSASHRSTGSAGTTHRREQ